MKLNHSQKVKIHKRRIAQRAVGPSTVRGRPEGTVDAFRDALELTNLDKVSHYTSDQYAAWLNTQTKRILKKWKKAVPNNGVDSDCAIVRKCLNIFLTDAAQHTLLRKVYKLNKIEKFLEVPIDSQTAEGILKDYAPSAGWPRINRRCIKWRGINYLNQLQHDIYQEMSLKLANRFGVFRYELDAIYWRNNSTKQIFGMPELSSEKLAALADKSKESRWW